MKRAIGLVLILALAFSLALAGCRQQPVGGESQSASEDTLIQPRGAEGSVSAAESGPLIADDSVPAVEGFRHILLAAGEDISPADYYEMDADEQSALFALLQAERWQAPPAGWQGKGSLAGPVTIFTDTADASLDGATLYVGREGETSCILIKWGENQQHTVIWLAPEAVAGAVADFRQGLVQQPRAAARQLATLAFLGYDKEGPGDMGLRHELTEKEQAALAALLQPDAWQPAEDLPAVGVDAVLQAADAAMTRSLTVARWDETNALVLLTEGGNTTAYFAPAAVAEDAAALADELRPAG